MSYQAYVIAAYAVFVAVLLWDVIAPQLHIAQLLRAVRRRAAPRTANAAPSAGDALNDGELRR